MRSTEKSIFDTAARIPCCISGSSIDIVERILEHVTAIRASRCISEIPARGHHLERVGHILVHGDYHQSWQPQPMRERALDRARDIAERVTGALGGRGSFAVELFVRGDEVLFNARSRRVPHDTGIGTISQGLSQFAIHARALLGPPILNIRTHGPSASSVMLVDGDSDRIRFDGCRRFWGRCGPSTRPSDRWRTA